jgi:hypothetical protein
MDMTLIVPVGALYGLPYSVGLQGDFEMVNADSSKWNACAC